MREAKARAGRANAVSGKTDAAAAAAAAAAAKGSAAVGTHEPRARASTRAERVAARRRNDARWQSAVQGIAAQRVEPPAPPNIFRH